MNTKTISLISSTVCILFWTLPASAAVTILDNNFDGLTLGNYSRTGAAFGADSALGNATGGIDNTVVASGGVGNSQYAQPNRANNINPFIRSRETFNAATIGVVSFSAYFKYNPFGASAGNTFLMGFALPSSTDNVDPWTNNPEDRLLFGLERTGSSQDNFRFTGSGRFGLPVALGDTAAVTTLTVDNWYQLQFDLSFNYDAGTPADSTVTLSGMDLRNWGTDGLTGGASIRSFGPLTFNPDYGININTNNDVYAYIGGNGDRGAQGFDNILVTAIPEPGTLALMGLALGSILLGSIRLRR